MSKEQILHQLIRVVFLIGSGVVFFLPDFGLHPPSSLFIIIFVSLMVAACWLAFGPDTQKNEASKKERKKLLNLKTKNYKQKSMDNEPIEQSQTNPNQRLAVCLFVLGFLLFKMYGRRYNSTVKSGLSRYR